MEASKMEKANESIAEKVTGGFQEMSEGVTSGFQKMCDTVVGGYTKIEDGFVERFLTREGESVAEAKARLRAQNAEKPNSPAPVRKESVPSNMEQAIRDKLLMLFQNWNSGYDGWLKGCATIYEPDASYYISLGCGQQRLTLQQYQDMMGKLSRAFTLELGNFDNMIIRDDWCAVRYTAKIKKLASSEEFRQCTMEFIRFRDNGGDIGVRIAEVWALSEGWTLADTLCADAGNS